MAESKISTMFEIESKSQNHVVYKKSGKVCMMCLDGSGSNTYSGDSSNPFFTIPAGYRPCYPISFRERLSDIQIAINTDGEVYPTTAVSNTKLRGTVTYIVGT